MTKKTFITGVLFSPILLMADEYSKYMQDAWATYFAFVNSFMWILAILPAVVVMYAVSSAQTKIKTAADKGQGGPQHGGQVGFEAVGTYLFYVVGSILSVYIIYGVFGMVYADASSFGSMWDAVVTKFWKGMVP